MKYFYEVNINKYNKLIKICNLLLKYILYKLYKYNLYVNNLNVSFIKKNY